VAILAAAVAQAARLLASTENENRFQRIEKRPTDSSSIVLPQMVLPFTSTI
jgi:hypothetical protein